MPAVWCRSFSPRPLAPPARPWSSHQDALGPSTESQACCPPVLTVPAGSMLVIRSTGQVRLDVTTTGGLEAPKAEEKKTDTKQQASASPNGAEERRFVINEAGSATLRSVVARDVVWQFIVTPDRAPTIALTKDPEGQTRGALQLNYKVEDDYGVVGAQANFKLKKSSGANGGDARPLYDAPEVPLVLPQAHARSGTAQTSKDFAEHPWAGADATMVLTARDEAGNEGSSAPFDLLLPQRPFTKPVAKALIEQRRTLALDSEAQANVLNALDAITIAPDVFNIESNVYLGLRSIYWQLAHAKSDEQMRDVVTRMWDMATTLEDGNLSDVERELRAAQEALRQALERGASEDEIKKLADDLRAALDKFMQALAEQMQRNPQQLARPADQNSPQTRPQDLKSMIDRMERMARSGMRGAARQLLLERP